MAEPKAAPRTDNATHKRKIKYIKKKFQRDFIIKFCGVAILAMALASLSLVLMTEDTVTATYRYSRLTLEKTSTAIIPALISSNLAVLLALVVATVYVTLYVSHKIAGPLFRFEMDIKKVADGDLTKRFGLRQGDQLQDLVAQLNQLTGNMRSRVSDIGSGLEELERMAEGGQASMDEIKGGIVKLNQKLQESFRY